MNNNKEIDRLIKKGLFNKQLKNLRQKKKQKNLKILYLLISILVIAFGSVLAVQLISTPEIIETNQIEPETEKTNIIKSILTSNSSKDKSPSNILALGRPGQGYSGQNLTDTIIIIHLEPNQEKATLVSLPRDLLVKVPNTGQLTKINALYNLIGIEGLKEKISEITGLTIDHYVLIDLVVAQEIIELIDGLNIYVPQNINDPYFPGPNYTYQTFSLAAGWRYLDGPTALRYIRTRYTSPNGDFDRMARQQQVVTLLKQKVLELNLLWDFPTYLKMFNSLKNNIETDLGILELKDLWQTARKIKADQITHLVIDKKETNLLIGSQVSFGNQMASVVYPLVGQGNYEEIKKYIQEYIE
ncbi:LCP family protein [Patescibacteria group bacterium]|nr:LCP family protein [Patescibacteria group bacterium]MBU1563497.1 LCP family protein [Patescibacteria group bacterium]